MLKFVILVLCIGAGHSNVATGERKEKQQIFFPREETVTESPCVAYDGQQGYCRLLIQCATFFAEIAELSRSPCSITPQQQGVCCPPTKKPTKDPGTIAKKPEEPQRAIEFPPVSNDELNTACEQSLQNFDKKQMFTIDLVDRNIIAEKGSPVFWHSRLFETTDEIFDKGQRASIILEASNDLAKSFNLDKVQVEEGLQKFTALNTIISSSCPTPPGCPDPKYSYRTLDGSCNNLIHKDWGKTGSSFLRIVKSDYHDGLSQVRQSVTNQPLPSARQVSTMISPSISDVYSNLTNLIWQWGQFVDHDITHTPISKGARKADISCCRNGKLRQGSDFHPECLPISIPSNDQFYSKFSQECMEFVRSMPAFRQDCQFGSREQMNQITSYLDGSNVYGSTDEEARNLRSFTGGLLKIKMHQGREMLPGNQKTTGCVSKSKVEQCFIAGDTRVNEQPDLVVMHTVWVRQHNKIAKELQRLNPNWSDEVLYQESRRIIGAQLQHITYNEYLPIVLGRSFMETYGLLPQKAGHFRGYRDDVDATILNSFATAAFRYGHTLITDHLQGFSKFGNMMQNDEISKTQFLPFSLYKPDTFDSLIRGLALQQSQKFDRFVSDQLTNKLFAQSRPFGMDLVALNIQRGRDHGLPSYVKWRKSCDLPSATSWAELTSNNILDAGAVQQLQSIYADVNDIDLFVGGLSENTVPGTLLGPTFLCIMGQQFTRLKIGDRFYYENGKSNSVSNQGDAGEPLSAFTEAQLHEIRKTSLSRILCDNSDNVELMQPLAFVTAHFANKRAMCNSDILIPRMSLEPWINARVWSN